MCDASSLMSLPAGSMTTVRLALLQPLPLSGLTRHCAGGWYLLTLIIPPIPASFLEFLVCALTAADGPC